jgi:hypothetical protein
MKLSDNVLYLENIKGELKETLQKLIHLPFDEAGIEIAIDQLVCVVTTLDWLLSVKNEIC